MNKKGEITSSQFVIIIILVFSFGAILIFYFQVFADGGKTLAADTACRESIALRHSLNLGKFIESGKNYISLKCKTHKICLTSGNDNCENTFQAIKKDDPFLKIKTSKDEEKVKEQALDAAAEALIDCHTVLGQGKLDFMPSRTFEQNYCIICSRIALDEKSYNTIKDLNMQDLYNTLYAKKTPDGKSYLEYIYGIKDPRVLPLIYDGIIESDDEDFRKLKQPALYEGISIEDIKIFSTKDTAIIAQIQAPGKWKSYLASGGTGVVGIAAVAYLASIPLSGGLSLAAVGGAVAIIKFGLVGTTATTALVYYWTTPEGSVYSPPTNIPYDSSELSKIGCTSFEESP